jgi:hypothetical protein
VSTPGPDARFEDAPLASRPLRLKAESAEDLAVLSSLLQDAVGRAGDIAWHQKQRRLVMLVNRFRWEAGAETGPSGAGERVRTAVSVESALSVRARGLDPKAKAQVFELLAILFQPSEGCAGTLTLTLAGGAEIAVELECLDLALADLTEPWPAKASQAPRHGG